MLLCLVVLYWKYNVVYRPVSPLLPHLLHWGPLQTLPGLLDNPIEPFSSTAIHDSESIHNYNY